MKTLIASLALFVSFVAHADQVITCTGNGESLVVQITSFTDSVTHNGDHFTDCRRINFTNIVGYDCQDRSKDKAVMLFVHLENNRPVKGSVSYSEGGTFIGGPTDGSGIDLTCK
jgi:hypothetical protein